MEQYLPFKYHKPLTLKLNIMQKSKVLHNTGKANKKVNNDSCTDSTHLLLALAAATACSALSVKFLKKGELALLLALMTMPISIACFSKAKKRAGYCTY